MENAPCSLEGEGISYDVIWGKMGDKVEEKLKAENEKQKRKGKWKIDVRET